MKFSGVQVLKDRCELNYSKNLYSAKKFAGILGDGRSVAFLYGI